MPSPEAPKELPKLQLAPLPEPYNVWRPRVEVNEAQMRQERIDSFAKDRHSDTFTSLDSQLQNMLSLAKVLSVNEVTMPEKKIPSLIRRRSERQYKRLAREVGASLDYHDLAGHTGYDVNGDNIRATRESLLSSGMPQVTYVEVGEVIEHNPGVFPIRVDNVLPLATIEEVAAPAAD